MGIRPFQTTPQNEREWATFFLATQVTPSANSVGSNELQPASVAPGNLAPTTVTQINDTADTAASTAVTQHEAAPDPHPQYATDTALSSAANGAQSGAEASAAAALAAHVADTDPHPVYQTQSESDARYVALSNVLSGSTTYDPPSLVDGAGTTTTVTCTGAALGDFALSSFSLSLQGIMISAEVTAADTVTVSFFNKTGGTLDISSGTLRARVWK